MTKKIHRHHLDVPSTMGLPRHNMRVSLFFHFIEHTVEHSWKDLSSDEGGSALNTIERIDGKVHCFPCELHFVTFDLALPIFMSRRCIVLKKKVEVI